MVGDKIREIRTHQELSLAELASRVGVSRSYISQLERNAADPSVSILRKIAGALHVSAAVFFDEVFEEPVVIRRKTGKKLSRTREGISYQYLSPSGSAQEALTMLSFSIPAGTVSDMYENHSDLCIYVLNGSLSVRLGDTDHSLQTGDSLYLRRQSTCRLSAAEAPASGILCIKS